MRITWLLIAALVCAPCLATSAFPQVCGDANGDLQVDIADYANVGGYLWSGPAAWQQPGPYADCDNRLGVTIADAQEIFQYLWGGAGHFDCTIQSSYSFTPSLTDTVFLPYMLDIPDDIDTVRLPVVTTLGSDILSFYIPFLAVDVATNRRFSLQPSENAEDLPHIYWGRTLDTVSLLGNADPESPTSQFAGRHTLYNLVFVRFQAGMTSINSTDVIRSSDLRVAVEKANGDLYTPVIRYYQVPLPHPVVTVTPSPLVMESRSGRWSTGSYTISLTADIMSASFKVAVSDDWIAIDDPSSTVYTTPATVSARANASALEPGEYAGQITFTDIDPADAEFAPAPLEVTLTVTEPITIPPGDLNCDGQVSLGDVALLIDCLFIDTRPVPACD